MLRLPFVPRLAGSLAIIVFALTGCSPSAPAAEVRSTPAPGYPTSHIHGMSVDPGTNRVLLATHNGLFNVSTSPAMRIGPVVDLMGFTTAANGEFYASGHPGPGSRLPNPVGLIYSSDGGKSWKPLSRQGESDFHALAATDGGIVGFDGTLQTSGDGSAWNAVEDQFVPYHLSGTPRGNVVLATTEEGLKRSTDSGSTWTPVAGAPLLMLTALDGTGAAGITPDGQVYTSDDAGQTWTAKGTITRPIAAIAVQVIDESTVRIWVATETAVMVSNDGGDSFTDVRPHQK